MALTRRAFVEELLAWLLLAFLAVAVSTGVAVAVWGQAGAGPARWPALAAVGAVAAAAALVRLDRWYRLGGGRRG